VENQLFREKIRFIGCKIFRFYCTKLKEVLSRSLAIGGVSACLSIRLSHAGIDSE